jgi:type VI secretion system protein ImpE
MSDVLSALKAGDLGQTLQLLQQAVRQQPADAAKRVFLFQLLAVTAQWDRALTQLGVVAELDADAMPMVHAYREAIRCERWREQAFAGARAPLLFGTPEPWMAQLIDALRLDAAGDAAAAARLRAMAMASAPAVAGSIDDVPFEWLADADPRLGPMLELISNGNYYWLPMRHIARLRFEAPADLRDKVWMPAMLQLNNGGELVGFVPSRYPGTGASADDDLLLARRTDWVAHGADAQVGLGQRLLATDAADYALLDVRAIRFTHDAQDAGPDAAPAGVRHG